MNRSSHFSTFFLPIVAAIAALTSQVGVAQVAVDFTGSVAPDFTFLAFDGGVASTADGVDIVLAPSADNFGGLGTNGSLITMPVLSTSGAGFVTARVGATNDSPLIVSFREAASNEFFSYSIPASSFNATTFTTVNFDLNSFFFNGDVADATPNEAIGEAGVQSPFGEGNAFDFTVANVGIVAAAVPEPSSVSLLVLGGLALAGSRRRRNA